MDNIPIDEWRKIRDKMHESHPDDEDRPRLSIDIKDPPEEEDTRDSK